MGILDYTNALKFVSEEEIAALESEVNIARDKLVNRRGAGAEFTDWVDYPLEAMDLVGRIEEAARKIRETSDVLLVIGIGGP